MYVANSSRKRVYSVATIAVYADGVEKLLLAIKPYTSSGPDIRIFIIIDSIFSVYGIIFLHFTTCNTSFSGLLKPTEIAFSLILENIAHVVTVLKRVTNLPQIQTNIT